MTDQETRQTALDAAAAALETVVTAAITDLAVVAVDFAPVAAALEVYQIQRRAARQELEAALHANESLSFTFADSIAALAERLRGVDEYVDVALAEAAAL